MATDDKQFQGTTENGLVAEAMQHVDTFIFDMLSDDELTYQGAPEEPELDIYTQINHVILKEVTLNIPLKGKMVQVKVSEELIEAANAKSGLRAIIAGLVMAKPPEAEKLMFLTYLNLAVSKLTELSV